MPERNSDATFYPPEGFDVNALARSTIKSLELLAPWCQPSNTPKLGFANDIVKQAYKYAEAIDLSMVAAQKAYTVAEEAISLGELIPFSTPEEHQNYLVGMLALAIDGRDTATNTLEMVKDVRKDILVLLEHVQPGHEAVVFEFSIHVNGQRKKSFGTLRSELQKGIEDLEEFAKYIGTFVTWWDWMKMDTGIQYDRTQKIQINYDSLREKAVVAKWKQLQQQFASYSDQIARIQDGYPTLFIQSRGTRQCQEEQREQQGQGLQLEGQGPGREQQWWRLRCVIM